MVVCKFFQQGNCRFGQNCRFSHIYGSKYSYNAATANAQQPSQTGVTDEHIVNQVVTDVQAALNGGQWIISSYSPFKEKANFPGLTDLSPEEARLFIYEAKANNTLDQAVSHMNNLFKESRHKYEQLLQPTPTILNAIRSIYKGEPVSSPFTNNSTQSNPFGSGSAASSVFRSAVQGTSVFGQSATNATPSIFSQNTANTNTSVFNSNTGFGQSTNVFAQQNTDAAKSIFAQATQNVFGPSQPANVFAQGNSDSAKSIFAQATQNAFSGSPANPASVFAEATQSVFGQPKPQTEPFGQNKDPFNQQKDPFGVRNDPFTQNNPFAGATPQNVFQVSEKQQNDVNIYSDINDLSPDDIEAFKSDEFRLGFIPEIAPPHSLCF